MCRGTPGCPRCAKLACGAASHRHWHTLLAAASGRSPPPPHLPVVASDGVQHLLLVLSQLLGAHQLLDSRGGWLGPAVSVGTAAASTARVGVRAAPRGGGGWCGTSTANLLQTQSRLAPSSMQALFGKLVSRHAHPAAGLRLASAPQHEAMAGVEPAGSLGGLGGSSRWVYEYIDLRVSNVGLKASSQHHVPLNISRGAQVAASRWQPIHSVSVGARECRCSEQVYQKCPETVGRRYLPPASPLPLPSPPLPLPPLPPWLLLMSATAPRVTPAPASCSGVSVSPSAR